MQNKPNVLIPMAGLGSRFKAHYTLPKPLIPISTHDNKPMIQVVVENLNFIDCQHIFLVQKEHCEKYQIDAFLKSIKPDCIIVKVDGLTEGAACTTLLAKEYINNDNPLVIANSDQYVQNWNSEDFIEELMCGDIDGVIATFEASHPKWSYVKVDGSNIITEIAEKIVISNKATIGIYAYKKGSDYVRYAEQMINKNIRTNNEFYVAVVGNEAILENKYLITYSIPTNRVHGLGVPSDLEAFIQKGI